MSTFYMACTHFCSTFLKIMSPVEFLQREAINHNHIVTNDCAVVRVTVIKVAQGKVSRVISCYNRGLLWQGPC